MKLLWRRTERRALADAVRTARTLDSQVAQTVTDLEAAFADFRTQIDRLRGLNDAWNTPPAGDQP
jgi:hypothetical protein